jgi:hypothetical protein
MNMNKQYWEERFKKFIFQMKPEDEFVPVKEMKSLPGMEASLHTFVTSTLDECVCTSSPPAVLPLRIEPFLHYICS